MKRQLRAREVDGIAETGVDRISHIIIVFVFASQVPFEPPLHQPVQWAGTKRPAAYKPIVVLWWAKRGALGMVERKAYHPMLSFCLGGGFGSLVKFLFLWYSTLCTGNRVWKVDYKR